MKLIRLSLKNATVKWWRSLTLGLFIFAIGFVITVAGAFIAAIQNKVENVVLQGFTGHIQIRSDRSFEGDMVEQYSKGWDALKPLSPSTLNSIEKIISEQFPAATTSRLVRQSAYLTGTPGGKAKREETMLLGLDAQMTTYREAFLLTEGQYLTPGATGEILLTEEQAKSFQAKVGSTIRVTTKNRYGLNAAHDFRVVGIGNFIMLSLFSFKACYVAAPDVQQLVGLDSNEATDLLLFLPHRNQVDSTVTTLGRALEQAKIEHTITRDEKLTSDDIQVTSLDFDDTEEDAKVKLSNYKEMGQTFKSAGDIMFVTLNLIVIFLMIVVSILIMNLIYMMGIERYREIGTLRALGFTRTQVIRIFMGEILSITLLFGLLGVLVGVGLILIFGKAGIPSPIPAMDFIMGKTLFLEVDLANILRAIVIFIGFALVASFYPAYRACSVKPVESLRSV